MYSFIFFLYIQKYDSKHLEGKMIYNLERINLIINRKYMKYITTVDIG